MELTVSRKIYVCIGIILLCVVLILASVIGFSVKAEEFNETNPELTAITIDSDAESADGKSPYVPTTEFNQESGKYTLKSNAFTAWFGGDDISFAYKQYNVSQLSTATNDYIEAEITVDEPPTSSGEALHMNASIGLMFRSGLQANASEVFLHLRGNEVVTVYRNKTGSETYVQWTDIDLTFPCKLRMTLKGNTVNMYYKSSTSENYNKFKYPVGMNGSGPVYVGIAAHSCEQSDFITGKFSDLTVKGYGTWDPSSAGNTSSSAGTDSVVSEYVEEDPPKTEDMLYRNTFSSGELEGKENGVIENQEGNRVWYKNFIDGEDFFGDENWTDYEVSTRLQFTENCNPDPQSASNTFRLLARHSAVDFYGVCSYAAQIQEGYKISLYKRCFTKEGIGQTGTQVSKTVSLRTLFGDDTYTCLGDGEWHTFSMKVFDNKITVYWDGVEILSYTDSGNLPGKTEIGKYIFTFGNVGVATKETSVYIDDIIVTQLEDTFGGDYDNKIGGNFEDPTPSYITKWEATNK